MLFSNLYLKGYVWRHISIEVRFLKYPLAQLLSKEFFDILEEVVESNFLHKESRKGRTGDA